MHYLRAIAGLAILQIVGAVPTDAAEPISNHRNLTMPDGTIVPVLLPPGIRFVPKPGHDESTPDIAKRLSWNPGNGDICGSAKDYPFVDITTSGSPLVSDCLVIADMALDPNNQGYFTALQGGDLNANGDWCRLMYHGTCAFGIKTKVVFGAKVGSEDIGSTIHDALEQPGPHYNKMQWEGKLKCKSSVDDTSTVNWAIFHS